jgi:aminoglycoside phosphotransferase (APT) family kinase protein
MAREARLLAAFAQTGVPHPALIASCLDETVLGAVFYLMEPVEGFSATVALSEPARTTGTVRHRMGIEMVDGLAALAAVDIEAAGLGDFGKLDGFLERQVDRWASELAGYTRFSEWSGLRELGEVENVGAWLADNCPSTMSPAIIHGDYHIGNVIFTPEGCLAAIVDWGMATLGDPLLDFSRLLTGWPDAGQPQPYTMRVERYDGFPTREELIIRYAERTGRDLVHLPWFETLSCYKIGIILEGSYARAQAGLADTTTGQRLHLLAVAFLERARSIIDRC